MLLILLAAGWSGWLRDLAYSSGFQSYAFAVFLYVLMLALISKALSLPLLADVDSRALIASAALSQRK